jgi:N-acetylglucosamine kinase-like BadF-type ATPase
LLKFVYQDSKSDLPKLAVLCDEAATDGDKVAREILVAAAKEISLAVRVAAAKLLFCEQVPLVLVGGVYNSRWVADTAMNEIDRYYPKRFDFVVVADPVVGAVKLALEAINPKS